MEAIGYRVIGFLFGLLFLQCIRLGISLRKRNKAKEAMMAYRRRIGYTNVQIQ